MPCTRSTWLPIWTKTITSVSCVRVAFVWHSSFRQRWTIPSPWSPMPSSKTWSKWIAGETSFSTLEYMNTEKIESFLRRRRVPNFDGVFSIDSLPDRPRLLVCNTDTSDGPGRHWVCISVERGRGEFFDSFGCRSDEKFERYMERHCSSWTFNDRQLQSVVSRFADTIASIIARFVVEVSTCAR